MHVCFSIHSVILRATNSLSRILVEDFLGPENEPIEFNPLVSADRELHGSDVGEYDREYSFGVSCHLGGMFFCSCGRTFLSLQWLSPAN